MIFQAREISTKPKILTLGKVEVIGDLAHTCKEYIFVGGMLSRIQTTAILLQPATSSALQLIGNFLINCSNALF